MREREGWLKPRKYLLPHLPTRPNGHWPVKFICMWWLQRYPCTCGGNPSTQLLVDFFLIALFGEALYNSFAFLTMTL